MDTPDTPETQPGQPATGRELTCKELVELVTAYRDGALAPLERARFEAHIAICPPCARYVEQMDATVLALGGLAQHDDQELARLEDEPATQELLRLFRTWKLEKQP